MNLTQSLLDFWIGKFHAKGEEMIPFFVNCRLPKMILLATYEKLLPIETMPDKEKKDMKAYVNQMFPNKTIEERVEACKIIYTLGTIL